MTKKKPQKIIAQIIPVQYSAGIPKAQSKTRRIDPFFKIGLFFRRLANLLKRHAPIHKGD